MSKKRKFGYVASIFALMISSLILVPTASSEPRSMIGGTVDHGHPSVGKVGEINDNRDFNCTGTLIGRRTVLTAAHCFESGTDGKFEIDGQLYHGQAILHPEFNMSDNPDQIRSDLAIINLDRDVIGVSPVSLCQAQTAFDRLPVMLVGFGLTDHGATDYGTKRWMRGGASGSSNTDIAVNGGQSHIFLGDSGGPAFIETNTTECIIGVAASVDFTTQVMRHFRPDRYIDWINSTGGEALQWVEPSELRCTDDVEGYESCSLNNYWKCYINPGESEADGELVCRWGSKPGGPADDCGDGVYYCNLTKTLFEFTVNAGTSKCSSKWPSST